MGLEVLNEARTLEKKGVLAPRLTLGTLWEHSQIDQILIGFGLSFWGNYDTIIMFITLM